MPSNGVTISVTAETNAGGRKHMEDYIAVNLSPNEKLRKLPEMKEQAYVGVFDGHGGKEAAKYAREHLWETIQKQSKFQTHDVDSVKEAILDAYLELHETMLASRASWQPNKTGDLSTAGTTASTVIFRKNHIFVANVGDSTAIMGIRNPQFGEPGQPQVVAQLLTKDHKPDDPSEQEHIRSLGGKVALSLKGVMRVVWERQRAKSNGKKEIDIIPFLSVSRSLGDYWSYSSKTGNYTVSPVPYVYAFPLDLSVQKFIVIASDGLWNVMTPAEVVSFVDEYEDDSDIYHQPKDVVTALIQEALKRWERRRLQADNIAVLIAYLSEEETDCCDPSSASNSSESIDTATSITENTRTTGIPSDRVDSVQMSNDRHNHSPTPVIPDQPSTSSSSPVQLRHLTQNRSGSSEYIREVWSEGVKVEYENKVKLRHRRKHKKHKKHSLEKELARRGLHRHVKSSLTPISDLSIPAINLPSTTSEEMETNIITTSELSPMGFHDKELEMTESKDHTPSPLKRKHTPLVEEEEDEGVSLVPPEEKKIKPDLKREDARYPNHTFISLRSQRLSVDAGSDSGSSTSSASSGICSDMDCMSNGPEEGLPVPVNTIELSDEQTLQENEEDNDISSSSPSHALTVNEFAEMVV